MDAKHTDETIMIIQLPKGFEAIIDDKFKELNDLNWHRSSGYVTRNTSIKDGKRTKVRLHREIAHLAGWEIQGLDIDHINHDTLDNRLSNLRLVNDQQNQFNRVKGNNNTSGFKGVSFCKKRNKWKAQMGINGKIKFLGYYDTAKIAAAAYGAEAELVQKEYAIKS